MNTLGFLSGTVALSNTSDVVKVRMNNGVAILSKVEAHTSKKGNKGIKLVFRTIAAPNDETKGHEEYISLSEGARFARSFGKIVYLAKHSTNAEAIEAFKSLPEPAKVLMNEQGQPIVFSTNDEFNAIKETYGEETTFVWTDDDSKQRIAIQFINKDAYVDALTGALSEFIGGKYKLEVKEDDRGFQQLLSIAKAAL